MKSEILYYRADGLNMRGAMYWDETKSGKRPGVLVFPDAMGLSSHYKSLTQRLVQEGYAALACDLYGEGHLFEDVSEVAKALAPLKENPSRLRERAVAAFNALRDRAEVDERRIAAQGYCIGGTMVIELARSGVQLCGGVCLHGSPVTKNPPDASKVKGKLLVLTGADDQHVPREQRLAFEDEMGAAKVDWRMHVYGGVVHAYTTPDIAKHGKPDLFRYDASADRRSWREMLDFYGEVFA